MARKESPEISPIMQRLRDELDRRGIPWRDKSCEFTQEHLTHHVEKTWFKDASGVQVAVTWGWQERCGERRGVSLGYPGRLECWYKPDSPTARVMTVEEVVSFCLGGGSL